MIPEGRRIRQYEILSPLGAGGMGEVYLAEDNRLRRKVAIKFLAPEYAGDEAARRHLLREARSAAALDHPNICSIHEVGEEDGETFIVLQYIAGETVAARLQRERPALRETLAIAVQVAEALAEAHAQGIIHRDIKPQNIMLTPRGLVKVLDFGLAKVMPSRDTAEQDAATASLLSVTGVVVGTAPYMSPEQIRSEELDSRSDIFSFGAVLYELLSGRRPFQAKSTVEVMSAILTAEPPPISGLPPKLEQLLHTCLRKDRALRYQSMTGLIADLKDCAAGDDSSVVDAGAATQPRAAIIRQRSRRLRSFLLASAAVVALIIAAGLYVRGRPESLPNRVSAAYDYYVRGNVNVGIENRENNEAAIGLFRQALAADPRYAVAHAGLARAYIIKARYWATAAEVEQLNVDAEVAVNKALDLDPRVAEGHFARGMLLWTHAKRFPHEQAIQSYRRALELKPDLDEAHHQLGFIYFHIGLIDKGRREIQQALAINPGNTLARYRLGVIDMCVGKYQDALAIFESTPVENNPSLWTSQTSTALFRLGRTEEAMRMIEQFLKEYPKDQGGAVTSVKAMILAKAGRHREAEEAIQRSISVGDGYGHFHHTAYNIASAYAMMNRPAEATRWLQTAADDGFPCYPLFAADPQLDMVRKDAAFMAFMAGLEQRWKSSSVNL